MRKYNDFIIASLLHMKLRKCWLVSFYIKPVIHGTTGLSKTSEQFLAHMDACWTSNVVAKPDEIIFSTLVMKEVEAQI